MFIELLMHTLPQIRRHRNVWNQHPGSMLVVKSITSRREDLVREVFGMTVRVSAVKTGNLLAVNLPTLISLNLVRGKVKGTAHPK